MTLEEAIEHAKEVARTCGDKDCAVEYVQLAEWLSLLKVYTDTGMAKEVQRARHEMHGWQSEWKCEMERRKELEAENAKLTELVRALDWCTENRWYLDLSDRCDNCPLEQSDNLIPECEVRMRELGIEVDR